MRIAIAGKGGVGKTTIASLLAQALVKKGYQTLAIDSDSNPSLALALGASEDEANQVSSLLDIQDPQAVEEPQPVKPLFELSYPTPAGVPVVFMGRVQHADQGCLCRGYRLVDKTLDLLGGQKQIFAVTDMSSGLEYLQRGAIRFIDALIIVAEPYYRAMEAALTIKRLGEESAIKHIYGIANKVRDDRDGATVRDYFSEYGLPLIVELPYEERLTNGPNPTSLQWTEGNLALQKLVTLLESDHRAQSISDIIFALSEKFLLTGRAELSQREILAVRYLAQKQQLTVGQLAEAIHAAMSTTTAVVDKLVKKGLVVRHRDENDRRIVFVTLTNRGKALFKEHVNVFEKLTKEIANSLTNDEEALLVELMTKIQLN